MQLTESYLREFPASVLARYDFLETRNAASVINGANTAEFAEVVAVLKQFKLLRKDLTESGGNKSALAARIDLAFRKLGWREGQHILRITSTVRRMPWRPAGEQSSSDVESEVLSEGYKVDNLKGRVALDVEWNAKDGNLDRDLGAYRALYDEAIIDGAIMVTRSTDDLRALQLQLGARARLGTTTTTNIVKLHDRLTRGSAGGCPVLAVAITARCLAK